MTQSKIQKRSRVRFQFILLAQLFFLAAARADLVMEQKTGDANQPYSVTLKIHGDKIRMDQNNGHGPGFSVIVDLNTRDSWTLLHADNMFLKRSGADVRKQMEAEQKASGGTNELNRAPAPAVATGKTEKVGDYNTDIYIWSGANGVTETLWVATNFPGYAAIRTELAKLDKFNRSGPHANAQPELSALPGMVVKSENVVNGKKSSVTLVSAKMTPVNPTLLEVPVDYIPWQQPPPIQVTALPPVTNK